jgi:hypothetical protein
MAVAEPAAMANRDFRVFIIQEYTARRQRVAGYDPGTSGVQTTVMKKTGSKSAVWMYARFDPAIKTANAGQRQSGRLQLMRRALIFTLSTAILAGGTCFAQTRGSKVSKAAAEGDLARDWEKAKGKSHLTWEKAKAASRDAWERIDRQKP